MPKQAMVFAAGLGTRLRPLTDDKPKALVMLQGKTLLEYCITNLMGHGFEKIVVNIHHFAQKMLDEIDILKKKFPSIDLIVSDESDLLLETGGGLEHALKHFTQEHPILIHNVDVISNINLHELYLKYLDESAEAIVAVSNRQEQIHLVDTRLT